jgi:hypothetical protein
MAGLTTHPADRLRTPRTVVLGWCVAVRGVTRLACDWRRLMPLDLEHAVAQIGE